MDIKKKFGYLHYRKIKYSKQNNSFLGEDILVSKKIKLNSINFVIRFHLSPSTKATKTQDGKSILISLENGEGWIFKSNDEIINLEKGLFFGDKKNILNSENIAIVGTTKNITKNINWKLEKVS